MQPIALTCPSLTLSPRDLHDDATCTIHAVPPPVLSLDWETLAQLASSRSKPLDFNVCPTPSSSSCPFCGTTDKP
jgi:hypothetical protein